MAFDRQGEPALNSEFSLDSGWVSPRFGVKQAAPMISHRFESGAPVVFVHMIYPYKMKGDEFVANQWSVCRGGCSLSGKIVYKDFVDSIKISDDNNVQFKRLRKE